MSHKHGEYLVCPNCGFHARGNYCAQCGQETHLHKETFWGLVMHFIGHYFHYDSKFWQTLKALWFSPGKLTIAYWNKQRMRYLPPISLYILTSAVFFLVSSVMPGESRYVNVHSAENNDSISRWHFSAGPREAFHKLRTSINDIDSNENVTEAKVRVLEGITHHTPKIFFFMVPMMALILQLQFARRKEMNYVNHIIYALHFHAFWFSLMTLNELYPFQLGSTVTTTTAMLVSVIYFVTALHNTYNITWGRSIVYSLITAFFYLIFAFIAWVAILIIIMW